MTINIDKVKECALNLGVTVSFWATGFLLGREVYQVGVTHFAALALQNPLLLIPASAAMTISTIITTLIVASDIFSKKLNKGIISKIMLGDLVVSCFCVLSLARAAAAGYVLPAYVISGLTVSAAAMLIGVGIRGMQKTWKAFNTAEIDEEVKIMFSRL